MIVADGISYPYSILANAPHVHTKTLRKVGLWLSDSIVRYMDQKKKKNRLRSCRTRISANWNGLLHGDHFAHGIDPSIDSKRVNLCAFENIYSFWSIDLIAAFVKWERAWCIMLMRRRKICIELIKLHHFATFIEKLYTSDWGRMCKENVFIYLMRMTP